MRVEESGISRKTLGFSADIPPGQQIELEYFEAQLGLRYRVFE
jgi:hypothetical protein